MPSSASISQQSPILSRMWFAFKAGMQFSGKRKLYDVFGYPTNLTSEHLLAKYQRQDVTSRVVDMPPEEMWAKFPKLKEPAAAIPIWEQFIEKTDFWARVVQVDKLLSFGKFSMIWIGLPGDPKRAASAKSVDDIVYLQSYGYPNVEVQDYEGNTANPRFGLPLNYTVTVGPESSRGQTQLVHYSRIIHVVDRPLQGQIYGEPRLAQVYNVLDDMLKVGGGSAELYWLTSNRGMQVDVDKEMQLDPADEQALSDEIDEFQHQLRRVLRTRGVKINSLGSEVADPRGVFSVLVGLLASATRIPQRILMGAEAGQLASEQDRANWSQYIEGRRTIFGEPYVLKPTLQALEALGIMPPDTAKLAKWEWPEAFDMNPLEEAQTIAAKGRAMTNFARRVEMGNPLASDEECRQILGLPRDVPEGDTMPEIPDYIANPAPKSTGENPTTARDPATGADSPPNPTPKASSNGVDGDAHLGSLERTGSVMARLMAEEVADAAQRNS